MDALSYFGIVLVLGIIAQWISWRNKLPSILLLLAFGFGLSLMTGVRIDDYIPEDTLLSIVGIFVSIILFEGGMTLKFRDLKEAGAPVIRLCTITVLVSFALTFVVAHYWLGYAWQIAALLGAILVVTGPTVIAPLLRVIKPSKKVASILKWEGIVVDPIGAILALLVFEFSLLGWNAEAKEEYLIIGAKLLGAGVLFPIILAKGLLFLLKRHLIPDFLHSVFLLAVVAGSFAAANYLQEESGLLTVTVLGIALVNQKSVSVRHILEFKENLQVLIISLLFILLSGRIKLSEMTEVLVPGLILMSVLVLFIRPISVYLGTLFSTKTNYRERTFLAFLAPRGIVAAAVSSVFALEFEHAADEGKLPPFIAEQSQHLVPLVFFCIIGTVLLYGLFALPLAKRLGVTSGKTDGVIFAGSDRWIIDLAKALLADGHNVLVLDTKYDKIADAKLAGVPAIRANILSEYAEHELDLAGIGQLVAATPNDEINSLASIEYIHTFGRANIWQVAPEDQYQHYSKAVASQKRARICFSGGPTFRELAAKTSKTHVIKKTTINDIFTLADFFTEHGEDAILLFLHDEKSGLRPFAKDDQKDVENATVYALVSEEIAESPAEESTVMGL